MTEPHLIAGALLAAAALAGGLRPALAQEASSTGVSVHVVVTVEPRHGSNIPVINREDVMVYQGHDRAKVTDWIPLQGERAGLQLFILIDDAASTSLGSQLEDIRQFINAQPSSTAIGVAYMRNGTAEILENPTNDHTLAAKALRLPLGDPGGSGSPYFSLVDLIKRWPASKGERLLIGWLADAQENNYLPAIAAMNDLLAKYPRDQRLAYLAGDWLLQQQRYEQAVVVLERALNIRRTMRPR